ncbi:MAG: ankyrin repeat domain-containing protein [Gammaproteobacteria bacterium]
MQAAAQTPPSSYDIESYEGLHRAAHNGDVDAVRKLAASGADLEARDAAGRTPLHVAAFASHDDVLRALAEAGADLNAFEHQAYDIVTIAAVGDDLELLDMALTLGAKAGNVTSPYDGTALIAAAHLGHYEVVQRLIGAGAPLDHVNNLGWTALIEAVVLGNGGPAHIETVRALVDAGADRTIADGQGVTPLEHARRRGYAEIAAALSTAKTR